MKSSVTRNPVLTALFTKFVASADGFLGLKLAPVFSAAEQASSYYVFDRDNMLNVPRLKGRAPGTPFQRSTLKLSDDVYSTRNYGHETVVPDEVRTKYALAVDADAAAIRRNAHIILFNHDLRVKTLLDGSGVPNATPAVKWDAYANAASDPVGDVKTAKRVIQVSCGLLPNVIAMSQETYDKLTEHPKLKGMYTNTDGPLSREQLRKAFEVDRLEIAGSVENIANEGQVLNPAYVWGDNVYLAVVTPSSDLEAPNAARTFAWQGGSAEAGSFVETYRNDEIKSDVHRSDHHTDEKLTGAEMAYRFTDVLT